MTTPAEQALINSINAAATKMTAVNEAQAGLQVAHDDLLNVIDPLANDHRAAAWDGQAARASRDRLHDDHGPGVDDARRYLNTVIDDLTDEHQRLSSVLDSRWGDLMDLRAAQDQETPWPTPR